MSNSTHSNNRLGFHTIESNCRLFNRHKIEVLEFIRDNQGWTTFGVVLLAAVVAGGVWINFVVPFAMKEKMETKPNVVDRPIESGIQWQFDLAENPIPFLGLASSFGEEPYVYLLQFYGKNNTNETLNGINGFVQSKSSDVRVPIGINVGGTIYAPDKTGGIPPGAEFAIMTWPLPSNMPMKTGGITDARFLVDFAQFDFVLNYNGKQYTRTFTNAEIREPIEKFARERADEAAKQKPGVKLKSASPQPSAPNPGSAHDEDKPKPVHKRVAEARLSQSVPMRLLRPIAPLDWSGSMAKNLEFWSQNTGPVPCSFKATAQILGASYDHTLRHPFKATWLEDEPTGVRPNTAAQSV